MIQPVKGSLKHRGQDPGQRRYRPSSRTQTISTCTRSPSVDQEHPAVSLGEPWVRLQPPSLGCSSRTRALEGQAAAPRQPLPLSPLPSNPRLPSAGLPFHPSESEPEGVMRLAGKSQEFQKINKHLVGSLWLFFPSLWSGFESTFELPSKVSA